MTERDTERQKCKIFSGRPQNRNQFFWHRTASFRVKTFRKSFNQCRLSTGQLLSSNVRHQSSLRDTLEHLFWGRHNNILQILYTIIYICYFNFMNQLDPLNYFCSSNNNEDQSENQNFKLIQWNIRSRTLILNDSCQVVLLLNETWLRSRNPFYQQNYSSYG